MSRRLELDRLRKSLKSIHEEGELFSKNSSQEGNLSRGEHRVKPTRDKISVKVTADSPCKSVEMSDNSDELFDRASLFKIKTQVMDSKVATNPTKHFILSNSNPPPKNLESKPKTATKSTPAIADEEGFSQLRQKFKKLSEEHINRVRPKRCFQTLFSESCSSSRSTLSANDVLKDIKLITVDEKSERSEKKSKGKKIRRADEALSDDLRVILTELGFYESSTESKQRNRQNGTVNGQLNENANKPRIIDGVNRQRKA